MVVRQFVENSIEPFLGFSRFSSQFFLPCSLPAFVSVEVQRLVLNQCDHLSRKALNFSSPLSVLFLGNSQARLALDNEIHGSIQFVGCHATSGGETQKAAPVYPKVALRRPILQCSTIGGPSAITVELRLLRYNRRTPMGTELSKSQINRLGERLRKGKPLASDLEILDAYRRSFAGAHQVVVYTLRSFGLEPSGRIKTTISIVEKLKRESIRLSRLRCEKSTVKKQDFFVGPSAGQLFLVFPGGVANNPFRYPWTAHPK